MELSFFLSLQHKLRFLANAPSCPNTVVGKLVVQTTMALSLFHTERNLSQLFRKKTTSSTSQKHTNPSLLCHSSKRWHHLTSTGHLINAYKILSLPVLPSKIKGTLFQILSRTIWMKDKAFRSGLAEYALCLRCEEMETIAYCLYECENYSAKICI